MNKITKAAYERLKDADRGAHNINTLKNAADTELRSARKAWARISINQSPVPILGQKGLWREREPGDKFDPSRGEGIYLMADGGTATMRSIYELNSESPVRSMVRVRK